MNMVICDEKSCPSCGGNLKHYDCVKRIVRTKKRITKRIRIQRLRCESCGSLHRELPNSVFPYKQYESEVIIGVLENTSPCNISSEFQLGCCSIVFKIA